MSADTYVAVVTDSQTVEVAELLGQDTAVAVVTDSQVVGVVASTATVEVEVVPDGVPVGGGGGGGLTAEDVRDTIGTALVGTGLVTVTPSDAGDTITIATTATANSSNATLLARANHTGTQAQSTVTNLTTDLSALQARTQVLVLDDGAAVPGGTPTRDVDLPQAAMTLVKTLTFDTATVGNAVVASGDIQSVAGTDTYTAAAMHGGVAVAGANGQIRVDYSAAGITANAAHSLSVYFNPTTVPSGSCSFARGLTNTNTIHWMVRCHSDGKVDIADTVGTRGGAGTFTTGSWTSGQYLRCDIQVSAHAASSVTVTARVFFSPESTTYEQITATLTTAGASEARWAFGAIGSSTQGVIDTVRVYNALEWAAPYDPIKTYTWDDGVNGVTVVGGGSNPSVSGSNTYTTDAIHGGMAVRQIGGNFSATYTTLGLSTSSGPGQIDIYWQPESIGAAAAILKWRDISATRVAQVRAGTDGKIEIANNLGARLVATTGTWTDEQWLRFTARWTAVVGSNFNITVRVYWTAEATVHSEEITTTIGGATNAIDRLEFGTFDAYGVIDTVRVYANLTNWPGPVNPTVIPPGEAVWAWSSAVSGTEIKINVMTTGCTSVRCKTATAVDMTTDLVWLGPLVPDSYGVVKFTLTGTDPGQTIYYQVYDTPPGGTETDVSDGITDGVSFYGYRTKSLPDEGQDFYGVFGGCITNGASDQSAMNQIIEDHLDAAFMWIMNDIHYRNPTVTTVQGHIDLLTEQILDCSFIRMLLAWFPTYILWSDHDRCAGDNLDSNTASALASINAAKAVVPTVLEDPTEDGTWFRLLIGDSIAINALDTKSHDRSPGLNNQTTGKTMLGTVQEATSEAWADDSRAYNLWLCDVPFVGAASSDATLETNGQDKWWAYDHARTRLATAISAAPGRHLLGHSDGHLIGIIEPEDNPHFDGPIFCSAPLSNVSGGRHLSTWTQRHPTGTLGSPARQYMTVSATWTDGRVVWELIGYDVLTSSQPISYTWDPDASRFYEWAGGVESSVVLEGEWNGTTVDPVSFELETV